MWILSLLSLCMLICHIHALKTDAQECFSLNRFVCTPAKRGLDLKEPTVFDPRAQEDRYGPISFWFRLNADPREKPNQSEFHAHANGFVFSFACQTMPDSIQVATDLIHSCQRIFVVQHVLQEVRAILLPGQDDVMQLVGQGRKEQKLSVGEDVTLHAKFSRSQSSEQAQGCSHDLNHADVCLQWFLCHMHDNLSSYKFASWYRVSEITGQLIAFRATTHMTEEPKQGSVMLFEALTRTKDAMMEWNSSEFDSCDVVWSCRTPVCKTHRSRRRPEMRWIGWTQVSNKTYSLLTPSKEVGSSKPLWSSPAPMVRLSSGLELPGQVTLVSMQEISHTLVRPNHYIVAVGCRLDGKNQTTIGDDDRSQQKVKDWLKRRNDKPETTTMHMIRRCPTQETQIRPTSSTGQKPGSSLLGSTDQSQALEPRWQCFCDWTDKGSGKRLISSMDDQRPQVAGRHCLSEDGTVTVLHKPEFFKQKQFEPGIAGKAECRLSLTEEMISEGSQIQLSTCVANDPQNRNSRRKVNKVKYLLGSNVLCQSVREFLQTSLDDACCTDFDCFSVQRDCITPNLKMSFSFEQSFVVCSLLVSVQLIHQRTEQKYCIDRTLEARLTDASACLFSGTQDCAKQLRSVQTSPQCFTDGWFGELSVGGCKEVKLARDCGMLKVRRYIKARFSRSSPPKVTEGCVELLGTCASSKGILLNPACPPGKAKNMSPEVQFHSPWKEPGRESCTIDLRPAQGRHYFALSVVCVQMLYSHRQWKQVLERSLEVSFSQRMFNRVQEGIRERESLMKDRCQRSAAVVVWKIGACNALVRSTECVDDDVASDMMVDHVDVISACRAETAWSCFLNQKAIGKWRKRRSMMLIDVGSIIDAQNARERFVGCGNVFVMRLQKCEIVVTLRVVRSGEVFCQQIRRIKWNRCLKAYCIEGCNQSFRVEIFRCGALVELEKQRVSRVEYRQTHRRVRPTPSKVVKGWSCWLVHQRSDAWIPWIRSRVEMLHHDDAWIPWTRSLYPPLEKRWLDGLDLMRRYLDGCFMQGHDSFAGVCDGQVQYGGEFVPITASKPWVATWMKSFETEFREVVSAIHKGQGTHVMKGVFGRGQILFLFGVNQMSCFGCSIGFGSPKSHVCQTALDGVHQLRRSRPEGRAWKSTTFIVMVQMSKLGVSEDVCSEVIGVAQKWTPEGVVCPDVRDAAT